MAKSKSNVSALQIPQILIEKERIEEICEKYLSQDWYKSLLFLFIGIIVPMGITFNIMPDSISQQYKSGYQVALYIGVAITIFLGAKVFLLNKREKLVEQILSEAISNAAYTGLLVIATEDRDTNGNSVMKFLTEEHWGGAEFLPFVHLDRTIPPENQERTVIQHGAKILGISSERIDLEYMDAYAFQSIKRHGKYGKDQLFYYEFYFVKIDGRLKPKVTKEGVWRSIQELKNDPLTMKENSDVISKLDKMSSILSDCFTSVQKRSDIKVIWNITKECRHDCKICATHDDERLELCLGDKAKVLLSLIAARDYIKSIDFAGGDPLVNIDSKKIIKYAIDLLGKSTISITTTGKGIETLSTDEKYLMLNNCELTIDSPESDDKIVKDYRTGSDYNDYNYAVAEKERSFISNLTINIPILKPDATAYEIDKIAEKINNINPERVNILRLMPVGKFSKELYPENYNPTNFIEQLKSSLSDSIQVHYHCALRVKYDKTDCKCSMLERKIGIDCAGNVFACAWAAYLPLIVEENPFYLGNLVKSDLIEIIDSTKATTILQNLRNSTNNCCIFSYLYSDKKTIFAEEDPLKV